MREEYLIEMKYGELRYSISVKDKYTIICGDSGTGKTAFCRILEQFYNEYQSGSNMLSSLITINGINWEDSDCKIYLVRKSEDIDLYLKGNEKVILVLDEDHKIFKKPNIKTKLDKKNCYFILITRKCLNSLSMDVDNIYTLTSDYNGNETINSLKRWIQR
jgi:hypothetical protein